MLSSIIFDSDVVISRRVELVLLAGIVLLTAVLRLEWSGLTEFKADETRRLLLALEMAEGGGMYTYPALNPVAVFDEAGILTAEAIVIPLQLNVR